MMPTLGVIPPYPKAVFPCADVVLELFWSTKLKPPDVATDDAIDHWYSVSNPPRSGTAVVYQAAVARSELDDESNCRLFVELAAAPINDSAVVSLKFVKLGTSAERLGVEISTVVPDCADAVEPAGSTLRGDCAADRGEADDPERVVGELLRVVGD